MRARLSCCAFLQANPPTSSHCVEGAFDYGELGPRLKEHLALIFPLKLKPAAVSTQDVVVQAIPLGKDYEMYMRDILNMFDYYVMSGRLSKLTAYRLGGWELIKHWHDKTARYSLDSFEELL